MMINELKLNGIATFTEPVTMKPLKINFCYGSNGSGKTTIASVIADCPQTVAQISWSTPNPLSTLVYNRDFVKSNFSETSEICGIFTLGKDSKEAHESIEELRTKADECGRQIEKDVRSKNDLLKDLESLESTINDGCWKIKGKYDGTFPRAFDGLNKSKKSFREKCVSESRKTASVTSNLDESRKTASVTSNLDELKRQYGIAFGETRPIYPDFDLIETSMVEKWENCDLLSQRISGSTDTPIGKFIEYLGNSDWVKKGIPFADKANGKCPFCQRELQHDTYDEIKAFFDDSYERDLNNIKDFFDSYSQNANDIISKLQKYADEPLPILDYSLFEAELDTLNSKIEKNIKDIEGKLNSPSVAVSLDSLYPLFERINKVLSSFNESIAESNDYAKNQKLKQEECIDGVWQIVISELKSDISTYENETAGKKKGIKNIEDKIDEHTKQQQEYHRLITEKEGTLTSVKPTADSINLILTNFGFEGFSITENTDKIGTYKIIRNDGKNVEKTLSEGEFNFLCFLYFYQLIYGSQNKTGIAQPKVVVIDDPISSLDSNVLFIVSTLTKQIIDDCRKNREGIKQVFIFSHNVYFHKEVTFFGNRDSLNERETAFWIVKKKMNVSQIVYHKKNPIQTSYELLWSELKDTDNVQRITIFNTLRRILEYYFCVIGGTNYEECIKKFDGEDKLICKSLVACINEGSHFITDDFGMQHESEAMENYIRVFKLIFYKLGHESHYNMMMGIAKETE